MNKGNTKKIHDERWGIKLSRGAGSPLYAQLADAVERAINTGYLSAGDRLPPHHDLARDFDVNITTITKAFSVLKRKGLVDSRPGRGTIVSPPVVEANVEFQTDRSESGGMIDLSVNSPATSSYTSTLARLLPELPGDKRFADLQDYQNSEGPEWAREAGVSWIGAYGPQVDKSRVLITDGAQHALACALAAVTRPGDRVLADSVTYQGVNALCRKLSLGLKDVPGDEGGMVPEALDRACREGSPKVLFLVPSLHNPTTVTLSEERRRGLLEVAQRHNMLVLEDDVYAPLLESRPPALAELDPERTIYVTGLSKCVAPGLRAAFVVPPARLAPDIAAAIRIDCWGVSPLTCLVVTRMIENGTGRAIVEGHRAELRQRNRIARKIIPGDELRTEPTSTHAWLRLPEPWRGISFTNACQRHGVRVLAAEAFTLGRKPAPHAVRVNVSAARSQADLKKALCSLRDLLYRGHLHVNSTI
ncbi:MAG: PLP-dependent aminotransferase family protein [Arenicellales bacterium]